MFIWGNVGPWHRTAIFKMASSTCQIAEYFISLLLLLLLLFLTCKLTNDYSMDDNSVNGPFILERTKCF